MKNIKLVYKADTEYLALSALDDLEENGGQKCPSSITPWRNQKVHIYHEFDRELQSSVKKAYQVKNYFSNR